MTSERPQRTMAEAARLEAFLARMAKRFVVEPADEADFEQVARLFTDTKTGRTSEHSEPRFRYRYRENPVSSGEPLLLVCRAGKDVVGIAGLLPTEVWDGGRPGPASFCIDLVVEPRYRGFGVAHLLQQRANQCAGLVMDGNFNEDAHALSLAMGARDIQGCNVYRRWTRPFDLLRSGGARIEQIAELDERFDRLWQRARETYPLILRRDRSVLAWRYLENPFQSFRIYALTDGTEIEGYVVALLEPWRGPLRRATLVDLLFAPLRRERAAACLSGIAARLARAGAACIDAVATHPDLRVVLEDIGFRSKGHDPGFMVYETAHTADRPELWSADSWYLTYGDSDFFL